MFKPRSSSFAALNRRYHAGRRAVRVEGADPWLTFSYVLWPTLDVDAASRGEFRGRRLLTEEEARLMHNERHRRYYQPQTRKWAA